MSEGKYCIQLKNSMNTWERIPESERVFIDGGCVMVYDRNDELIIAYAAGEWAHVLTVEYLEFMGMLPNKYGDLP